MTREYLVRVDAVAPANAGTSTSSISFGTGAKTVTTQSGKAFAADLGTVTLTDAADPLAYMSGTVTSYNSGSGSLVMNITAVSAGASGSCADWLIRQATPHYFSCEGFKTGPADTPANQHFSPRLENPGVIKRSMYGDGEVRGRVQIGECTITLRNNDGGLDSLITHSFDGQVVQIMRGTTTSTWAAMQSTGMLFQGVAEQPVFSPDSMTISARDLLHKWDVPLQPIKYAGTNGGPSGIEGTADDIKGHPKPVLAGYCQNITPVLVNSASLMYQYSYEEGDIAILYDKGITLTRGADYASQAAMEATAPAAGQYRVWPAGGCFRLGSTPIGQITADAYRDWPDPDYLGFDTNSARSVMNILLYVAGIDDTLTLSTSVSFLSDGASGATQWGVYVTDEMNLLDAMDEVLRGMSGYVSIPTPGDAYVDSLGAGGITGYALAQADITTLERRATNSSDRGIPTWRVNLGWSRNSTVQNANDIAGAAASRIAFASSEYRTYTQSDKAIKALYPLSPELNIDSACISSGTSGTLLDYLVTAFGVLRDTFQVGTRRLTDETVITDIGSIVTITYDRYALDAGKDFIVLGYEIDCAAESLTLTLWG